MNNANVLRVKKHNEKLLQEGGEILNGIRLTSESSKYLKLTLEKTNVSKTKIINAAIKVYFLNISQTNIFK